MQYQLNNSISFIFILFSVLFSCNRKSNDYQEIFGDKYTEAEKYFFENNWITDTLLKYNVDPSIACSIVFPEVIRYSSLRDYAETRSLEALYTQYGSIYADFSIGRFQMKPSFAARLERDWLKLIDKDVILRFPNPNDTLDKPSSRMLRITRLKDPKWQVKYLVMFLQVMEVKYKKELDQSNPNIEFLASAYNFGYWQCVIQIFENGKKKYYYTGILKSKICYNYSDISLYYYKKSRGILGTN